VLVLVRRRGARRGGVHGPQRAMLLPGARSHVARARAVPLLRGGALIGPLERRRGERAPLGGCRGGRRRGGVSAAGVRRRGGRGWAEARAPG
jgi:hypothetical protein